MLKAALPIIFATLSLFGAEGAEAQAALRGSRASVDRIYNQAVRHNLHFYESATGVRRAATSGVFLQLTGNAHYEVVGVSHPYVLPSAHAFVTRLAEQYYSHCGERLVVTSAVRPKSLRLVNSTDKTVHPTGMAVDLRKPPRARCLSWLRETLIALKGEGVIDAVEEQRPPHFHVAVFPTQYSQYVRKQGGGVRVASAGDAAATPKPTAPAKAAAGTTRYRVRSGDSLWTIARRHGTSVDALKRANELRSDRVVAGQMLVIPKGR